MTKHIAAFFVAVCLLVGCAPATVSPTPVPIATVQPTFTPFPTPSPTTSPLPETQEHLIVTRDREHWAVLHADGSLQKYITVPELSDPSDISPDGNWLAYGSGSYKDAPYDYSLNLFNLDSGASQFVVKLLSKDFPENIEPIVKTAFQYDPALYGNNCKDTACRRALIKDEISFSAGISRWSPDGKWLAFAAQIDGPSTDIYLYNMEAKTIRRLTDDLQSIDRIEWSPDGKRILYANNIPGLAHDKRLFYVTDLEGKSISLSQEVLTHASQWYMHGWISNDRYLLQALYPEPGQWHFRELVVVNIENGQLTKI